MKLRYGLWIGKEAAKPSTCSFFHNPSLIFHVVSTLIQIFAYYIVLFAFLQVPVVFSCFQFVVLIPVSFSILLDTFRVSREVVQSGSRVVTGMLFAGTSIGKQKKQWNSFSPHPHKLLSPAGWPYEVYKVIGLFGLPFPNEKVAVTCANCML